jgi:phospholipid/cholesterol/gamma-HCH transport system substrate-binding protein
MENRSYALLAGIFTLLLIAAAVAVAIWLGRDKTEIVVYDIVTSDAVGGLSAQSAVRFQGVPVGHVLTMVLDPNKPGYVHIRIGVSTTTPVTDQTWAELAMQGITGLSLVDLHDPGTSGHRLETSPDNPGVIPMRPGLFSRLSDKGAELIDQLNQIAAEVKTLVGPENQQALATLMKNSAEMSTNLIQVTRNLGPLTDELRATTRQVGDAAQRAGGVMQDAHAALARLSAPDGPLTAATQSLNQFARAMARLDTQTLPAVSEMAGNVSVTARGASAVLRRVGDAPQSILFGLPSPQPGPGEAGFVGFGGK